MKKTLWAIFAILIVMFGFPWAAVTFAPGDAAMAVCFVLFFVVIVQFLLLMNQRQSALHRLFTTSKFFSNILFISFLSIYFPLFSLVFFYTFIHCHE